MYHSRVLAFASGLLLLSICLAGWPATIAVSVSDANPSPENPCTLAQAIYAANLANNPDDSTPAGATTIAPLSDSATTTTGSCAEGDSGANTIDLSAIAGQTITFSTPDNFWYGPNALPPIASTMTIEGNGVRLVVPNTVTRLRFFFVGANASSAATPGYNTPGAGNLTLHNLTLTGGHQLGGAGGTVTAGSGGGGSGMGGAVFNQGTLTLDSVTLFENSATGGSASLLTGTGPAGGMGADPDLFAGGMGGPVPAGTADAGDSGSSDAAVGSDGQLGGGAGGGANSGLAGVGGVSYAIPGRGGNGGGGGGGYKYFSGIDAGGNCGGGGGGFGGGQGGLVAGINQPSGGGFGSGGFAGGTYSGGGGGGVGGGGNGDRFLGGGAGGGGFGGGGGGGNSVFSTGGGGGFGGGGGGGQSSGIATGFGGFGGGNGANLGGGGGGAGLGGAIFNHFGQVNLTSSTLSGNVAAGGAAMEGSPGSGYGGAIFNLNGLLTVNFSTIVSNTADDGGAIYSLAYNGPSSAGSSLASLVIGNSIMAKSTAAHDLVVDQPANTTHAATPYSSGVNVASANTAATGKNLVMSAQARNNAPALPTFDLTADPQLGSLGNYGGLTPTKLPKVGSPLVNAAASSGTPTTDQRGLTRIVAGIADIGADERQATEDSIFLDGLEGF